MLNKHKNLNPARAWPFPVQETARQAPTEIQHNPFFWVSPKQPLAASLAKEAHEDFLSQGISKEEGELRKVESRMVERERAVREVEELRSHTAQKQHDAVNHPKHYTSHPSGVECITITEHYNFCVGNAIKYLWRNGLKADEGSSSVKDLKKAIWYINREIENLEKNASS